MQSVKLRLLLATLLAIILVPITDFLTSGISVTPASVETQDPKTKADLLLQKGASQYQAGEFANAIQSWEEALKIYQ